MVATNMPHPAPKGQDPKHTPAVPILRTLGTAHNFAAGTVDRDALLAAISDTTVASATLDVVYSRPSGATHATDTTGIYQRGWHQVSG
jgi:hypothetical protein